jgi:hypothetical protein
MKKIIFLKQLNLRFSKSANQSDTGNVFLPEDMYLTLDFIGQFLNSNEIDELDDYDCLELLKKHFRIKYFLTFDFNGGMGASSNSLVILITDNTFSYLLYDFALNGELWILAAFTNPISDTIIDETIHSLISRQGNLKVLPFQILYGLPDKIQNHAPDIITREKLQDSFLVYYNYEENMKTINSDADSEFFLLSRRINNDSLKQNKYSVIERKKIIESYFDLNYNE